jgi:hypothetical protein
MELGRDDEAELLDAGELIGARHVAVFDRPAPLDDRFVCIRLLVGVEHQVEAPVANHVHERSPPQLVHPPE